MRQKKMKSHGLILWTAVVCTALALQPVSAKFYYGEYKTVAQLIEARAEPPSPLMNFWSSALKTVTSTIYRLLQVSTVQESDYSKLWEYSDYSEYSEYYPPEYSEYPDSGLAASDSHAQHVLGIYPQQATECDHCSDQATAASTPTEYLRSTERDYLPNHGQGAAGFPVYPADPAFSDGQAYPGGQTYPEYEEYAYSEYSDYADRLSDEEREPLVAPFVPGGTIWVGLQMVLPVTVTAATAAREGGAGAGATVDREAEGRETEH